MKVIHTPVSLVRRPCWRRAWGRPRGELYTVRSCPARPASWHARQRRIVLRALRRVELERRRVELERRRQLSLCRSF